MSRPARVSELTAGGRAAIRVLALEGEGALGRLATLLPGTALAAGTELVAGTFARVGLREPDGSLLDEAIVLVESATRVELHLHGSPALVERVRARLAGTEPAELSPREQAPSLEERAERRLEQAASEPAARILLAQAEGALRAELERLLAGPDAELVSGARALAERGRGARWILAPPRVVLAGPVNAGKSTLFNLLVGHERVVVSAAPGTTRDVVHARVRLGELAVDLFDTAGTRALEAGLASGVERAGQDLARECCASADLVLWLTPAARATPPPPPLERTRVLHTLADLDPECAQRGAPSLSALRAPVQARRTVEACVREALGLARTPVEPGWPVPFEEQQIAALARAEPAELRGLLARWLGRTPAPIDLPQPLA